jgi:hypothetical protein
VDNETRLPCGDATDHNPGYNLLNGHSSILLLRKHAGLEEFITARAW